jgi:hypothetical protein
MTSTQTMQAPLEVLVASQLGAIHRQEVALHGWLQSSAPLEAGNISTELWKLQVGADRLDRMVDAMGLTESYAPVFSGETAA